MNRRNFVIAGAGTLAAFPLAGCPTFGSVMSNLAKYLPVGLQALSGVANLISPGAGSAIAALIGLVNVAWGGLQAAVNDYNSAPQTNKQTYLEKVLTALDAVQANLSQTLNALGVGSDAASKAAIAALLVVTTTLGTIEAQLAPSAAPTVSSAHLAHAKATSVSTVQVNGIAISVSGKPQDFKREFNTIMQDAGRPDLKL